MQSIAIVGGGIAGLALAARLDPRRWAVTLHEERAGLPTGGTALGMWPAARRALDRIGIGEQAGRGGAGVDGGFVHDASGRPLVPLRAPDMLLVSRGGLLRLLAAAVPESVCRLTRRVESLDGLDADVVVGADGVHSLTRRARWGPGSQARLTPYLAVRGVIDQRSDGRALEFWGGGGLFGITPSPGDRTNWFASFRAGLGPRSVDVGQALELARPRYAAYPPQVRDLLAGVDPEATLAQRIWIAPRLRSYARGRVVLVGDAAHAMTPNLGRGACEALVDAVILADLLNSRAVPDALSAYDRRRVPLTQGLRTASSAVMRIALADRLAPARDRVLALVGRLAD